MEKISHSGLEVNLLTDFEILKQKAFIDQMHQTFSYTLYSKSSQIIMINVHVIFKQRDPRMAQISVDDKSSDSEADFENDVGPSKNTRVVIIESDEKDY